MGLSAGDPAGADPLAGHAAVAIDSNVLIYLLETIGTESGLAGRALDSIETRPIRASLSTIAVAEILSGPARAGDLALMERYLDELRSFDHVSIVPVDDDIAFHAARLRARDKVAMPDAINLAAAQVNGATAFITNDRRLRSTPELEIIQLAAFTA